MKLTVNQLRRIIKEEVSKVVEAGRRSPVSAAEKLVADTVAEVSGVPEMTGGDFRATAKELQILRRQSLRRGAKPRKYRPGEEWKEKYQAEFDAERQGDELSSRLQADIDAASVALGLDPDVADEVFMSATEIGRKLLAMAAAGQFDV